MVPVVIIPVLNRYDLLERCIDSIDYPIETLIIIDNGGQIYEQRWLVENSNKFCNNIYILRMPTNLGVATSWNLGIKMEPFADGWILLNSDAWFEPMQLQKFATECHPHEIHLGGTPGWCCAWIGSKVVAEVGLFCEAFHPAYFEDTDYERRAVRLGFNISNSEAVIRHNNSSTLLSSVDYQSKNAVSYAANLELFKLRNARLDAGQWDLQRRRDLSWD